MAPIAYGLSVVRQASNHLSRMDLVGCSCGDMVGRRLADVSANYISNTPSQTIKA